jgi:hypothetical protein
VGILPSNYDGKVPTGPYSHNVAVPVTQVTQIEPAIVFKIEFPIQNMTKDEEI